MRMFNADGSESEMCGNGVRCVAKYVYDHNIATRPEIRIETGRGVLSLRLFPGADGKVERVRVDMGEPILEAARIPTTLAGERVVDVPLTGIPGLEGDWQAACGLVPKMTCVSMGNPHVVLYCADVAKVPLERVGPILERADLFPRRINAHFVQVHSPARSPSAPGSAAAASRWRAARAPVRVALRACSPAATAAVCSPTCPGGTSNWSGPNKARS